MTGARSRRIAAWFAWIFMATLLAVFVLPTILGHPALAVSSGSMAPAAQVGDLLIEDRIAPGEALEGDVITFRHPTREGEMLTHRVERVVLQDGIAWFTTRGDANPASEEWSIPANGTIGRVHFRIPAAGYLVAWARNPAGYTLLILIPAAVLAGWVLRRIWRRGPEEEIA